MKDRILEVFPEQEFDIKNSQNLYIVDMTNLSKENINKVIFLDSEPSEPFFYIKNSSLINIVFVGFKNHVFKTNDGNDAKHCECLIFPEEHNDKCWLVFLEIKNCKGSRATNYRKEIKEQLILTLSYYREKNIIPHKKIVYLVYSFPRKDNPPFNSFMLSQSEILQILTVYKAHIRGVNQITVMTKEKIEF